MSLGDWAGRAVCAAITFGLAYLRARYLPPENNLQSVALTHCLSAICNACAILAAYRFTRGKTSFDLQRLAFLAIVVNALSILAYAAKSSPLVFAANSAITVISYVQFLRLLWPGNGDVLDTSRCRFIFRVADIPSKGLHMETKK
jgi:hypothetical protein